MIDGKGKELETEKKVMDGLYYRLKEGVVLRGWDMLPFTIVNYNTRQVLFSKKDKMQAALACNGNYDFSSILMPVVFREYAEDLVRRGLAERCEKGEGITDEQRYRRFNNPFISEVHWEMTGGCNYKCRHCFMSAPQNRLPQLSTKSALKIVDELSECGVMTVNLSGGEPLIRPDIPLIIAALSEKRIIISQFYSNGALINEKLLDVLESNGQSPTLLISYDGVDGWHDWMRDVKGASEKAERAICLWKSRGLPVWAQSVVHKGNKGCVRDTANYLASLGCDRVRFISIDDEGEWPKRNDGMRLSIDEYYETALSYIPMYYEDGMPLYVIFESCFELDPEKPDEYKFPMMKTETYDPKKALLSCRSGRFEISPEGKVCLCNKLGKDQLEMPPLVSDVPGVKTASLSEILGEGSVYRRTMALTCQDLTDNCEECRNCVFFEKCLGGCRARAKQAGSLFGPDPKQCAFFRNGWQEEFAKAIRKARPTAHSKVIKKEDES